MTMKNTANTCRIEESTLYGIKTLTLSNDLVSIRILVGKGGEINRITYLPKNLQVLLEDNEVMKAYEGRDLEKDRLANYSELFMGGWPDVIPGFGYYGEVAYKERPIGLAATLPWLCEILKESDSCVSVKLKLRMELFPLYLVKTFTLKKGEAAISIEETVKNEGKQQAAVTWTQHAAFAGDFLDETVRISFPAEKIFIPSQFANNGGREEDYIMPIEKVRMPDGTYHDLHTMRARANDGHLVFTQKLDRDYYEMYNQAKKIGFRMKWDKEIYPYLRCWYQNTSNGYSIALEPCNYYCHTFEECVRNGMFLFLEADEEKSSVIRFSFFE